MSGTSKRHHKWWTAQEQLFLLAHVAHWSAAAIGRALGRTVRAVEHQKERMGAWPTRQEHLTSGRAARIAGVSSQRLTRLAREGRLKAHRVPGGRWWLFDLADLERLAQCRTRHR